MSEIYIAYMDRLPSGVIVQINEHVPSKDDVLAMAILGGLVPRHYYTAYIAIPKDLDLDMYNVHVHGGITYGDDCYESRIPLSEHIKGYNVIGWDYMHAGDSIEEYTFDVVKQELFEALAEIYEGA